MQIVDDEDDALEAALDGALGSGHDDFSFGKRAGFKHLIVKTHAGCVLDGAVDAAVPEPAGIDGGHQGVGRDIDDVAVDHLDADKGRQQRGIIDAIRGRRSAPEDQQLRGYYDLPRYVASMLESVQKRGQRLLAPMQAEKLQLPPQFRVRRVPVRMDVDDGLARRPPAK